jgi:ABC-type phosphate/phosphonate transport system substrate-binding protein
MFANTRMYSVNPTTKAAWQRVLRWCLERAGLAWPVLDHDPPASISELWARSDMGLMQMCGLPYALRDPAPRLIAAPVPSPARYSGRAVYFSDLAVRADAPIQRIEDAFGKRIGWTLPDSQSGYFALRHHLLELHARPGSSGAALFGEVVPRLVNPRGVIQALLEGRIDIGPLDSFSHDLIRRTEPEVAKQIRVVASTAPTTMPPFVCTHPGVSENELARLRAAFLAVHEEPLLDDARATLLVQRFVAVAPQDYQLTRQRHDAVRAAPELW